jgi:hypothetical protein
LNQKVFHFFALPNSGVAESERKELYNEIHLYIFFFLRSFLLLGSLASSHCLEYNFHANKKKIFENLRKTKSFVKEREMAEKIIIKKY